MPRNSSGVFSPPAGTTPVPNTLADATKIASYLADLGSEITASLPTDGRAPMTGPLRAPDVRTSDGAVGTPAHTFTGDTTSGMSRSASALLFSFGGVRYAQLGPAGVVIGPAASPWATIADNLHTFTGTGNTIVYANGGSGYGAFQARGSGTNPAYLFFANATNGEQARITGTDGGTLDISSGPAAVIRARIALGWQIPNAAGGVPTGGDMGAGTINVAGNIFVNGVAVRTSGVTAVTAGDGLTGGSITGAGTIAINTNNALGVGAMAWLQNGAGQTVANGATTDGRNLTVVYSAGGSIINSASAVGNTWRNVSGIALQNGWSGMWIRTA